MGLWGRGGTSAQRRGICVGVECLGKGRGVCSRGGVGETSGTGSGAESYLKDRDGMEQWPPTYSLARIAPIVKSQVLQFYDPNPKFDGLSPSHLVLICPFLTWPFYSILRVFS